MNPTSSPGLRQRAVHLPLGAAALGGLLSVPPAPLGLVLMVAGDPGLPHRAPSPALPASLHGGGLATLQVELLARDEQLADRDTKHLRFNVALLADRLGQVVTWAQGQPETAGLPLACVAEGSAGGAALRAAAALPHALWAVALWGGRPDLVGRDLARVQAPTLLLVDEGSPTLLELNRGALALLGGEPELALLPQGDGAAAAAVGDWLTQTLFAPTLTRAVGGW